MIHREQLAAALLATLVAMIAAADAEAQAPGFGYAVVSPIAVNNLGGRSAALGVGGGVEAWIGRDVSAGAELDDVYFPAGEERSGSYTSSWPAANAFFVSGNLSRHFARQRATAGFITGGVSILAVGEPVGLFNVGGGLERRLTRRTVLRLELRDALLPSGSVLLAFRAGVVIR